MISSLRDDFPMLFPIKQWWVIQNSQGTILKPLNATSQGGTPGAVPSPPVTSGTSNVLNRRQQICLDFMKVDELKLEQPPKSSP